jgi:phosphoglycolate phosphatase
VLFDFDGTLADTAPDLGAALNQLRTRRGLAPLPVEDVRPYASMGARGLLRVGFNLKPDDAQYAELREEFLQRYEEKISAGTRLFPGMQELIQELRQRAIRWGIVTNKSTRLTRLIVRDLALEPDCVVCGDSTAHLKPHPAPMLLAAKTLALDCGACLYLGDDLRDIQAARAAGMRPVAVEWGYVNPDNGGPPTWNADALISHPREVLSLLA